MRRDAIALEIAVAMTNSPNKSCGCCKKMALDKIPGLTARMYAIVIKVVTPARTSVRIFVRYCSKLKNRAIAPCHPEGGGDGAGLLPVSRSLNSLASR